MITLLKMVVLYLIYPIREQEYGCSLKMRMDTYKEVFLTKVAWNGTIWMPVDDNTTENDCQDFPVPHISN